MIIILWSPVKCYDSLFTLMNLGTEYQPPSINDLLGSSVSTTVTHCAQLCNQNRYCRVFNFINSTCQLYQSANGNILMSSESLSSVVGRINYSLFVFSAYGQSCDKCFNSRYLICINNLCACPSTSYYNGTFCQDQLLVNSTCSSSSQCRQDLNLLCIEQKCKDMSYPQWNTTGVTVAGTTGISGGTMTLLNEPHGLFIDPATDLLYIADRENHRIQQYQFLTNDTSIINTVAGTSQVSGCALNLLNYPTAVSVDKQQNLYIADASNNRILYWPQGATDGVTVVGFPIRRHVN
ncbi:unnamed protein product [Didymodactylos carnosus]|uniref:Apple domain-containing protein n=1 Tax=Didymodactylos carnosus TaxID=1234261 RepID=A0A814VGB1_9BILA|nr:unnamed protein product [Didymodactylos carnosus]CAF3952261.1 unnamed protein product [Didymodactylos carnosus]